MGGLGPPSSDREKSPQMQKARSRTRTDGPFLTISRRRFAGACGCSRFSLVSADFATNGGDSFAAVCGCCVAQSVAHLTSWRDCEMCVDELHGHRSFADRGGTPLGRA